MNSNAGAETPLGESVRAQPPWGTQVHTGSFLHFCCLWPETPESHGSPGAGGRLRFFIPCDCRILCVPLPQEKLLRHYQEGGTKPGAKEWGPRGQPTDTLSTTNKSSWKAGGARVSQSPCLLCKQELDSLKLKSGVVHLNSQYEEDRQICGTHPVW